MSERIMQAIEVDQFGGPEQLRLKSLPWPDLQAHEVLVHIHAAGVLPVDWKIRQGLFQAFQPIALPYIPGSAFAGIIREAGPAVTRWQAGQAVFGRNVHGTYSEYTTATVETIALKPDALSFEQAATLSGGATTAWEALFERGAMQASQRVLVLGAAGGVGAFAVQFAARKGAQVLGTTSTSNLDFVSSLGADTVFDYTTTDIEALASSVDLVIDTVGEAAHRHVWSCLKRGGRLISLAGIPSQERTREHGVQALFFSSRSPSSQRLQEIAEFIVREKLHVPLGATFPLHEARRAHELSQAGHGRGRIVLCLTP